MRSLLSHIFHLVLVLAVVAIFYEPKREGPVGSFDFRNGDVLFIRGRTWRSLLVRFVETADDFSHVGILRIVDGIPYVVHATPEAEVVRLERVEDFLSPANADRASLYRLNNAQRLAEEASWEAWNYFKRGVSFDHRFNISDEDKLYCTELVWRVFKKAGVDLGEGDENFLYDSGVYGKVLLPQGLSRCLSRVLDIFRLRVSSSKGM
ncbi:MAG: hypothetical protein LBQ42_01025 [Synergistaceae bacterium]|jgi:hypothetical protein|nr:hypothetical protein [Synergistaceae bacterium]